MGAPTTFEELEKTAAFQAGRQAKKERRSLAKAVAFLNPASWQYDAFIAGYDYKKPGSASKQQEQT